MPEPVLTEADQQRLLAAWNARRYAQDAFHRSVRRSTQRLLRHPAGTPAS